MASSLEQGVNGVEQAETIVRGVAQPEPNDHTEEGKLLKALMQQEHANLVEHTINNAEYAQMQKEKALAGSLGAEAKTLETEAASLKKAVTVLEAEVRHLKVWKRTSRV